MDKGDAICGRVVRLRVSLLVLLAGCANRWNLVQPPAPTQVHVNNLDPVQHVPPQAIREYLRGQIYWADGEYQLAQEAFSRALLHDPQSPWIVAELAVMLEEWETDPMEEGSSGAEQVTPSMIK